MSSELTGLQDHYLDRYGKAMLPLFSPSRVLVSGDGAHVVDADGQKYLDMLGGIAVCSLGYNHPRLVAAIREQAPFTHVSNLFTSPAQVNLAERLMGLSNAPDGSGVFFTNSGAEANEAAFKLARRTGRPAIVALEHSFHGRTMGALALTHNPAYREPFEPLPGPVRWVRAHDVDALQAVLKQGDVAAVIVEPIQGEAGVIELSNDYLRAVRDLTREAQALMIVDEVQTGIARTGAMFAHRAPGIVPDAVTLAKGLGGGVPIGALLTFGEHATSLLKAGQHGTTFGGNPLACASALAVLDEITEQHLCDNATRMGTLIREHVERLDGVKATRGRGLLLGIELAEPCAKEVTSAALARGLIINAPRDSVIRLAPPLVINEEHVAEFIDKFAQALAAVSSASARLANTQEEPSCPATF